MAPINKACKTVNVVHKMQAKENEDITIELHSYPLRGHL